MKNMVSAERPHLNFLLGVAHEISMAMMGAPIFLLLILVSGAAIASDGDIIFSAKSFYDSAGKTKPDIIYIAGTLTGEGLPYKNNTTAVVCYSDLKECFTYSVEQIGENQVGPLRPPDTYPVIKWDQNQVVASGPFDLTNCTRLSIRISRRDQTALWVTEPMNRLQSQCEHADATIRRWTIEDPPTWRAMKGRTRSEHAGQR